MVKRIIKKCTKNGTPIFCKTYLTIRIHKVLQDYKDTHLMALTMCSLIDVVTITNFFSDRH